MANRLISHLPRSFHAFSYLLNCVFPRISETELSSIDLASLKVFSYMFCKETLRKMSYLHFIEAPEKRRHSSRSSGCLHSVTASLDKRRVHVEKLWAISLSSTLWTLLSMVWQRSSAWRAEHISSTASPQQDLFYDRVNKARVWRPKAEAKGLLSKQYASACLRRERPYVHTEPSSSSLWTVYLG